MEKKKKKVHSQLEPKTSYVLRNGKFRIYLRNVKSGALRGPDVSLFPT